MENITRFYRDNHVLANSNVDFELRRNEIHALVGENGAGKTTLMKILYGLEQPDEGRIFLNGSEVFIRSPLDANRYGIGMVHQHFRLIPDFTAAENIIFGMEPKRRLFFLNRREAEEMVRSISDQFGFDVDPSAVVKNMTVGEKQQVEIMRMLYRNDETLILDEPTSVLTGRQIESLFYTLKKLTRAGKSIILITHKLNEVLSIADRVSVMRQGKVKGTYRRGEVDKKELSQLIFGRDVQFFAGRGVSSGHKFAGKKIFELKNVSIRSGDIKPLLDSICLSVSPGEIVGVTGAAGNGLRELEDVVSGLRDLSGGQVFYHGEDITNFSVHKFREKGFAYVPADRMKRGSSLQASLKQNLIIINHDGFSRFGILNRRRINSFVSKKLRQFSIDGNPDLPLHLLSGGNIQKTVLARELSIETDFIIFSEPTWGLDSAAGEYVYKKIRTHRDKGKGVLLFSSNLDEILGLADTVFVLFHGRIAGRLDNDGSLTKELVGTYMLGLEIDE